MPRNKQRTRLRWFKQGVEALQLSCVNAPKVYCCPLCVRGFTSPDDLSLEDVPPRSIGGRPLVLTCRECNSTSGHKVDAFLKYERIEEEIAEGKRPAHVTVTQGGNSIAALATMTPGQFLFEALPKQSDPQAHRAFFERLDALAKSGSRDWGFNVTLSIRRNPSKAALGWLRVGYLYAFAAFGYQFALRRELDLLREQLRRPEEELVSGLVRRVNQLPGGDGISIVEEPPQLRSVLVRLGPRFVFLPGFSDQATFYERLASPTEGPIQFRGWHLDLPRGPSLRMDFDRRLLLLASGSLPRTLAGDE